MGALPQIREQIRAYVAGACSVNDLQLALAAYHQEAADASRAGDARAELLVDRVLALVSEYGDGHRGADDLRDALAALLPPEPIIRASVTWTTAGYTLTGPAHASSSTALQQHLQPLRFG